MRRSITYTLTAVFLCATFFQVFGQTGSREKANPAATAALQYLKSKQAEWKLTDQDVNQATVQYQYSTAHNGLTHVYLIQRNFGIELYNGIVNVNVTDSNTVLSAGNRFMTDLMNSANTTTPVLKPEDAVQKAAEHLKLTFSPLTLKEQISDKEMVFEKPAFSNEQIHVKLRYQKINETSARLAWDLDIDAVNGDNHWSFRVDAVDGRILSKTNWTKQDNLHSENYKRPETNCAPTSATALSPIGVLTGLGTYDVFEWPLGSPGEGARTMVTNPGDPQASPFGWHDTNGVAGPEYTITRGNNVWAFLDWKDTNTSSGDEPNGGPALNFDAPFFPNGEPDTNRQAATIQLFYANNMMHDFSFKYGFDEASGNYQQTNYTGQGKGNDYVKANAQNGAKLTDGTHLNNANFTAPPDGQNGRMRMYLWQGSGNGLFLHVTAPAAVKEDVLTGGASFGPVICNVPVSGDVVIVKDSAGNTLGCNITNDLTGKIAWIDRGTCFFSDKVLNAQNRGAIGVIVANNVNGILTMGGSGTSPALVKIPSVLISKSDADLLRPYIGAGLKVSIYDPSSSSCATKLDGDFDNTITAHEYTHGISIRLTGGPQNSSCLENAEQMGEGWSDFMSLAVTVKNGDAGATARGEGPYVVREGRNAVGIRQYPYSTDMAVDPHTYDDIILTPEVHDLGETWTTVLWDMYWAFVGQYGFDPNARNTKSGNGKAVQLVIDGMKLQPCGPGFLDGRDAILAADRADNAGANQCLIWSVFTQRGMGYYAREGSSDRTDDNTEDFTPNPFCSNKLQMTKTSTDLINPGDVFTDTIRVVNFKGTAASNIVVIDQIPANATYVAGSSNIPGTVVSGTGITFTVPTLNPNDTLKIIYKLKSDPAKRSIAQFLDNMENGPGNWRADSVKNSNQWQLLDVKYHSPTHGWVVGSPVNTLASDQALTLVKPLKISGTQPVLRFYQSYLTDAAEDGLLVQISTNAGSTWSDLGDKIFKNPYRGVVRAQTFATNVAKQKAFWGTTNNQWQPVYADLSAYSGQNAQFRFRFASSDSSGANYYTKNSIYFIDDVSVMDMANYNGTARLLTGQGDTATATGLARGTIVEPTLVTPTLDLHPEKFSIGVYPNPARDLLNISIPGLSSDKADIRIFNVAGVELFLMKTSANSLIPVNMADFPTGVYFVKVQTDQGSAIEKVVKQ